MAANDVRPGTTEAFDRSHTGRMKSARVDQIYRAAFGDDYPQTAQPNAFYSRTTLQRLAAALRVGPGETVVDLGCGHGGPGLWVAQQTGASLIGIDLSPSGSIWHAAGLRSWAWVSECSFGWETYPRPGYRTRPAMWL